MSIRIFSELGKQLREDELKRHRLVTEGHQMYLEVCQEGNNAKLEKKVCRVELFHKFNITIIIIVTIPILHD